jgi:DNA-cytosine methyltransferase
LGVLTKARGRALLVIRYGSVCSGIEAATVAWHGLGWQPAWFSEIEPFPSAVLAHHYPHVPNLGDMTKFEEWHHADESPNERTEKKVESLYEIPHEDFTVRGDAKSAEQSMRFMRLSDGEAGNRSQPCNGEDSGNSVSPVQCETPKHRRRRLDDASVSVFIRSKINFADVDLLVGGTPCQAFSVAGLRRSLADDRGNLSLIYVNLLDKIDEHRKQSGRPPAICVWENVPGVLSTKDNAFGCFLAALAGENVPLEPPGGRWSDAGCVLGPKRAIAWRILDAQYFGLAQRRKRVFLVSSARDGFRPEEILFERESVRRDSPPSREARQAVARGVATGAYVGNAEVGAPAFAPDVANCLETTSHDYSRADGFNMVAQPVAFRDPCPTLTARMQGSSGWAPTNEDAHLVGVAQPIGTDCYNGAITGDVAATLGTPGSSVNASGPTVMQPVAFAQNQLGEVRVGEVLNTLNTNSNASGRNTPMVQSAMQVRRLTPVECERLQGFPDGYTNIPWRKKDEAPDGPRYKALGNSMAVPVMRWIGERIAAVDAVNATEDIKCL